MSEWLIENKEWIFSGIGVAILSIVVSLILRIIKSTKESSKGNYNITQVHGSSNVNINVNSSEIGSLINKSTNENSFEKVVATIEAPKTGQVLDRKIFCSGTIDNYSLTTKIWLIVEVDGLFWPKQAMIDIDKEGYWNAKIYEGGSPEEFSIAIITVTNEMNTKIEQWLERCSHTGDYPGLTYTNGIRKICSADNLKLK